MPGEWMMADDWDRVRDQDSELARLTAERDALIEAAIVEEKRHVWCGAEDDTGTQSGPMATYVVHVWRIGPHSGHEPTRELARAAVKRAVGITGEEPTDGL